MEQYERNWKNYYEILQLSPNAEPYVITAAYRRLAREYHPDTTTDNTNSLRMSDINEAYEVLSNSEKRAKYDNIFRTKYSSKEETPEITQEEVIMSLMAFAAEEAAKGKKRREVIDELIKMGVPQDIAVQIESRVYQYKSEAKRKAGGKQIGCGLLMLIVGGIVTWITYSASNEGGYYIVTTGLFIVGAINLIIGLFRWITS